MKSSLLWLGLTACVWIQPAQAVSDAACIWLMISPSTRATGMGNTFSPLSDDPFNAWLAPGSEVLRPEGGPPLDLSLTGYPGGIQWAPFHDVQLMNQAVSLRLDLQEWQRRNPGGSVAQQPWQLSLSYLHNLLEEGEQTRTDEDGAIIGTSHAIEQSHSLRLGLGQRRERWSFGLGLGADHVISDLASGLLVGGRQVEVGHSTMLDAGLNLQAKPLPRQWLNPADPAAGYLDWSLGLQYSKLFLGSHISYVDGMDDDPMPFHDRLALASRWRLALPPAGGMPELPVLEAHVALERSIELIRANRHWVVEGIRDDLPGGHWNDPNDAPDDLSWDKHYIAFDEGLFHGRPSEFIHSRGWELGVLGFAYLRGGHYADPAGLVERKTSGGGLQSGGLVNWLLRSRPERAGRPVFQLLRRLDLRFDWAESRYRYSPSRTKYRELSLRWNF
ncbi:MAG: hypothetical protein WC326_13520 [Candidatus Delongbacteria bacterium]